MYELTVKNRDYLRISITLAAICIGGLVFSLFLYDMGVDQVIRMNVPLRPKSMSRNMFLKLPFPLEFHTHIFHVENPEEVQKGGKPQFKDIGPYVFHEYILKHDTVDDDENDTLTYTLKKTWIFKPELSKGLTGDENVTIIHPVISSLALTVNVNKKGFLKMISEVIGTMFNPTTPFWTGRAMDLFFDGIPIDCSSKKFNVKSICAIFRNGENAAIQPVGEIKTAKTFTFSLLGAFNDSFNGRFKVYRGKKEITDVGRIIEVDGEPQLGTWASDEENRFKGTDGYFMPPFLSTHEPLFAFERMLCVSLGLEYTKKSYIHGLTFRKFTKNLKDFASNPAYCRPNGSCPIEGTLDLFSCMGAPIIATLPHFLDTHPSLLENVASGLNPKRKDHEIAATVDLKTGLPLIGTKRMQFNFEVIPIPQVAVMKDLREMIFPFAWIEERAILPGAYAIGIQFLALNRQLVSMIKYLCFTLVPIAAIVSLAIHFLIKFEQIQTDDFDDNPLKPLKVIESKAFTKVKRHVTEVGIGNIQPNYIN